MNRKERGITLIELLVSLSILSIIGIIIWNVFFEGYQFSKKALSKNYMIQETNLLITNLIRIHQTSTTYTINKTDNCGFTITVNGSLKTLDINPDICFDVTMEVGDTDANSTPIHPNQDKVSLKLIASDRYHPDNNNLVEVNTILSRLKTGEY